MSNRVWLSLGVFWSLLSLPLDVEGLLASVKAYGMGGTGAAYPQDALSGAYNPATMVYVGTRADIGAHWQYTHPQTTVTGSTLFDANGSFQGDRGHNFGTPDFGFNYMVFNSVDVSIGLVGYTRDFLKASYDGVFPAMGTTHLMMQFWEGILSPIVALRFDRFAIGVSGDFMCQTLKVEGLQNFDTSAFTQSLGNVTNRKISTTQGFTWTVGGIFAPTHCLSLGAMYQFARPAHHFRNYRGLVSSNGELKIPARIVAGFHYHPTCCPYSFAVDMEHIGWSAINWWHHDGPSSMAAVTSTPFGSSKGPGFGWLDQFIAHVGADCKLSEGMIIRAGYRYSQQLVRTDQTFMNALTCPVVDQLITFGFTVYVSNCSEVSGYYAYGQPRKIKGKTISADFGGGTYDLYNQTHQVGISTGWNW